jgi:DNA polymerase III subunit epsilon
VNTLRRLRLSALEDPGRPIPPESTAIHGITDDMVKGQRFDDAAVASLLDGVALVIAHNATFDRPFLEARFPLFEHLHWGCSIRDIPAGQSRVCAAGIASTLSPSKSWWCSHH